MAARTAVKASAVERERAFAYAYLEHHFNGTKAALSIGIPTKSATVTASQLLTSANVQAILAAELEAIRSRQQITINDMYEEWRRIAFSNMDDYSYEDGDGNTRIQLPHGDRAKMAAVKSVETFETEDEDGNITRRIKLTLHDKVTGMDKLSRLFGMWDGKEAPVTVINGNVQVNDNRKIEQTTVIVNVGDAAEEYRKLLGR